MFAIGPVLFVIVSLIFGLVHTACQSISFLSFCENSAGKSAVIIRAGLFSIIVPVICTHVFALHLHLKLFPAFLASGIFVSNDVLFWFITETKQGNAETDRGIQIW